MSTRFCPTHTRERKIKIFYSISFIPRRVSFFFIFISLVTMRVGTAVVSLLAAAPAAAAGAAERVAMVSCPAWPRRAGQNGDSWARLGPRPGLYRARAHCSPAAAAPSSSSRSKESFGPSPTRTATRYGKHLSQDEVTGIVAQPESVIETTASFLRDECGATDIKVGPPTLLGRRVLPRDRSAGRELSPDTDPHVSVSEWTRDPAPRHAAVQPACGRHRR